MINKLKQKIYNILRWSEKWTKTDMVYLFKGGSWFTSSEIISNLLSFGLSIAYANLLSQQTFGTYKYLLSAYGLISLVALPGIVTAVTQSVSRGYEGSLRNGFKTKMSWGFLGTAISLILATYYFFHQNLILAGGFAIIGIFIPLVDSFSIYSSFLIGKKLFKQKVICGILTNIFSVSSVIITILITNNIFILLTTYFSSLFLAHSFFYQINAKKFITNNKTDVNLITYGKSLTACQIFSNAAQYIDKILLFTMLGSAQVAIFTFASALPDRIKYIFRFTITISMPKFVNNTHEEIKKTLPKKIMIMATVIAFVILCYIVVAPLIFKYIFPQYISAILFSQIIALTSIYAIDYPIGAYLQAHKKVKELFIISSSSFILGVISMVVFIPLYGIWGAVIGLAINRLANMITSFYFLYNPIEKQGTSKHYF